MDRQTDPDLIRFFGNLMMPRPRSDADPIPISKFFQICRTLTERHFDLETDIEKDPYLFAFNVLGRSRWLDKYAQYC